MCIYELHTFHGWSLLTFINPPCSSGVAWKGESAKDARVGPVGTRRRTANTLKGCLGHMHGQYHFRVISVISIKGFLMPSRIHLTSSQGKRRPKIWDLSCIAGPTSGKSNLAAVKMRDFIASLMQQHNNWKYEKSPFLWRRI